MRVSNPTKSRRSAGGKVSRRTVPSPPARKRTRLPREEREKRIVQGAIEFFADVGLSGDTRQLARRLHITHPLLYRYFGSKEALLERVYEEVYMRRWDPHWEDVIRDRSIPLRARITRVYNEYARAILSYEWVRIFLYSGLRDANVHRRILQALRERIFAPICAELRHDFGLPGTDVVPPTDEEIELVWASHTVIFYYGVRKWVYHSPVPPDVRKLIDLHLDAFFAAAPIVMPGLVRAHEASRASAGP